MVRSIARDINPAIISVYGNLIMINNVFIRMCAGLDDQTTGNVQNTLTLGEPIICNTHYGMPLYIKKTKQNRLILWNNYFCL